MFPCAKNPFPVKRKLIPAVAIRIGQRKIPLSKQQASLAIAALAVRISKVIQGGGLKPLPYYHIPDVGKLVNDFAG